MTVKVVRGDMVLSYKNNELDAYAHQANCFCRMGRGIAPLLAEANPDVRKVDNETLTGCKDKLGDFSVAETKGFPLLFNVYGQYHWRKYKEAPNRNTNYEALREGLIKVKEWLEFDNTYPKTLGLPLIGCGLAGGDWEGVVLPMIRAIFKDSSVVVTVFVL